MAKEEDDWDLERGPRPAGYTPVVVAAPPSNIGTRRPRPTASTGEDGDDDDEHKIPSYINLGVGAPALTAVVCCPLLALVLTRTDSVTKAVLAGVMLPIVVGVFFVVRAMCKRPRMALVADVVKR